MWEILNGSEFVQVTDARVQYDPPSTQTTLQLTNLSLSDTATYRCRGTGGLANETAANSTTVIPGKLYTYFNGIYIP